MISDRRQEEWCIAGDGAIGMALAYRFHQQSLSAPILTKHQQAEAVEMVYEPVGQEPVKWSAHTLFKPSDVAIRRLVIATKAYSVADVIEKWSPSLTEDAVVYFLQNGTGFYHYDLPQSVCSLFVVNGGFTAYLKGVHHVVQSAMKPIWIGVDSGDSAPPTGAIEQDLQLLDSIGFHVRWTDEIVKHRWEKLSINAIVNAQAVIYNAPNGELLTHPEATANTKKMCDELGTLFEAMKIDISADGLYQETLDLLQATSKNICSTLQDYRRGVTRHELDYINLALIKEGQDHQISMPVCEAVYAKVKSLFLEKGRPSSLS